MPCAIPQTLNPKPSTRCVSEGIVVGVEVYQDVMDALCNGGSMREVRRLPESPINRCIYLWNTGGIMREVRRLPESPDNEKRMHLFMEYWGDYERGCAARL
jgi:hypothetical protein